MNKLILWNFLIVVIALNNMAEASLPEHPVCGVHSGDSTSATTEFPWTAHIVYTKPGNKKGIHCRGTLINERYVLTGGHCVRKLPKTFVLTHVKLGGINSANDIAVAEIIPNENYDAASNNNLNDIALLKLEKDVQFNDKVQPICLPVDAADRKVDLTSKVLKISEYEHSKTANNVEVYEVPKNDCKVYYDTQKISILDSQICAGAELARNSCKGSGGGALMKYGTSAKSNTQHFMLVGVSSFGPRMCGTIAEPDVYTRVSDFMDWIVSKVN
ncbi:hypothetical protein ACKWTF_013171 [Chironomus riparius]